MGLAAIMSGLIAPILIDFLKDFGVIRTNSRNMSDGEKNGTPIMGGIIFIIPTLILGIIANYTIVSSLSTVGTFDIFSGSIKILLTTFAISALLGGIDDMLNIFGVERSFKDMRRILKLIKVHKSYFQRIKMTLMLPWTAYKNFFFILGSNPGKGIQAHEKIIVQVIVGSLIAYWVYFVLGFTSIWFPFIGYINVGLLMIPFTILSVVVTTNAVNITDGMDGLSAGLSIIAFSGFLFASSIRYYNEPITIICAIAIGALLPYLYLNVRPAKVQMGDVGSLALGTLLASVAFSLNRPFLLIPFCLVFYIELMSSLIQGIGRRILGRRILRMAPLHHHLEMIGYSEQATVLLLWAVGIIGFFIGMLIIM